MSRGPLRFFGGPTRAERGPPGRAAAETGPGGKGPGRGRRFPPSVSGARFPLRRRSEGAKEAALLSVPPGRDGKIFRRRGKALYKKLNFWYIGTIEHVSEWDMNFEEVVTYECID